MNVLWWVVNFPLRVFPWFTNRRLHCHNQCHACSVCLYHSDTHCLTGKDRCRISFWFCTNTCKRTVCFATTANHLKEGLWSWKGICHDWFHLAIGLLVVAILERIQLRLLQSNAGLSLHYGLYVYSQDMLSQSSKGRRELVTFWHMLAEESEEMSSQFGVRINNYSINYHRLS